MPTPTCNCIVCGIQTSKRQSISITYQGVTGRACRTHPEVAEYLQKQFESEKTEKQMKSVNTVLQVMVLTSFIEVQKFINPLFIEHYYIRRIKHVYGEEVQKKVIEEVSKRKPLSSEDIAAAMLAYQQLLPR